jgi:hypothetical protein
MANKKIGKNLDNMRPKAIYYTVTFKNTIHLFLTSGKTITLTLSSGNITHFANKLPLTIQSQCQ